MIFEYTDLKPRNPFFALALEEAFCYFLAHRNTMGFKGGLRLWSNPPSIILGRTCKPEENLKSDLLAKDSSGPRLPVCRRLSGGGTVCHGPGNLNYSIYLDLQRWPRLYNVTHSYDVLLALVADSLKAQGLKVERQGQSDLVLHQDGSVVKFSGNSQFRKYGFLCLHGTLITNPDMIDEISLRLLHPPKEPEYRKGREHKVFLGALPEGFEVAQFFYSLKRSLQDFTGVKNLRQIGADDRQLIYTIAKELKQKFYTHPDWIWKAKAAKGRLKLSLLNGKNGGPKTKSPRQAGNSQKTVAVASTDSGRSSL